MLGMEVPGSNSVKIFSNNFCTPFLSHGDCSIRVSRSHDITLVWFLLYNFVAVPLLPFKLSKGTATIISLSTHQFSSFPILGLPVAMTEVVVFFM